MADSDVMGNNKILLCDHMTEHLLFENQTTSQRNCALVAVVALLMLCYAQSEHSNIVQRVNA